MKEENILYEIQCKLIDDLNAIITEVKDEKQSQVKNQWVFEYLTDITGGMSPAEIEDISEIRSMTRENLEGLMKENVDQYLHIVQKQVPEIKTEDVYAMIKNVGELYSLITDRAENELSTLNQKSNSYSSPKELIEAEFEKNQAFNSETEHLTWAEQVNNNLDKVLSYVDSLAQTVNNKKGLLWKGKVAAAKLFLKKTFDIKLDLKDLSHDVTLAKETILDKYKEYESNLIASRYC
jgi:hypothetical protein